jgi:thioredoxin-dependent adenylylsulfate APS reductase
LSDSAAISRPRIDPSEVQRLALEFEDHSAQEVLHWAVERFGNDVALSTSFQATGMVLLDMLNRISPGTRIFTLDTGRLPKETYELIDRAQQRYGCSIDVQSPDPDELKEIVARHGINMFYRSYSKRLLCCDVRKVKPLNRALSGLDAWITGLMRCEGGTRAETAKIEIDQSRDGRAKINPLAGWDMDRVWEYIRANDVPYNALYDRGYTSIGCEPCTRAIESGEDTRAGRWWWESGVPKECGIHLSPELKARALKVSSSGQTTTEPISK